MTIAETVAAQRAFFNTGKTLSVPFRRAALRRLRESILYHETEISEALHADLNKSPEESYLCEIGTTLSELRFVETHLQHWAADRRVLTPLAQFPARSFTVQEPYGVILILSPWNYPFLLALEPLIGAIAAGNCCVIKPSPDAPRSSAVLRRIITDAFPARYVTVVEGGAEAGQALLEESFDYLFFTGGMAFGREVMAKAAQHLTPVTLELGGKSPCIVERSANLELAAKRIAFGKLLNCGQTCVAPDYVLIDSAVKDAFLTALFRWINRMYGEDALHSSNYGRMINRRHFDRVCRLIDADKVVYGGRSDPETLKIQPTVLDGVTPEDAVMQEEIFGPVLPVLTYRSIEEAEQFVRSRPHPLALYLFTENRAVRERFLRCVPFGGGCINDTVIHLATSHMGFGGVGSSGMGSYHGKKSFETFSHEKSIVDQSVRLDLPIRYAPYTPLARKLMRRFLK